MGDDEAAMTILNALGDEGLAALEKLGERRHVEPGTVLFDPGDELERMDIVVTGAVEVLIVLETGAEHLVGTIRDGGILGVLQASDAAGAAGRARTAESCELLTFPCGALEQVLSEHVHLALPVLGAMITQMRAQTQIAIADLLNTVRWNADITGISQLAFGDLISSADGVTVELLTGRSIAGSVVRIDPDNHGGYVVLKCTDGDLHVVRSEAIASINCGSAARVGGGLSSKDEE